MAVLERIDQRPIMHNLAESPSITEVMEAVKKFKIGKAAESNGIAPEMVKAACEDQLFRAQLLGLIHSTWRERRVPRQWSDGILIYTSTKEGRSIIL